MNLTTRKYACLQSHNEVLMVNLPDELESHVTVSSPDGLAIRAYYIHARTGQQIRRVELNFHADVKLHFVRAELPGDWFYILQYSSYFQRYGCSCKDGKAYQQTRKPCDHMKMVSR